MVVKIESKIAYHNFVVKYRYCKVQYLTVHYHRLDSTWDVVILALMAV
jgi:hypothetical protein